MPPRLPFCISQFQSVRAKLVAPFRGTFRGIVADVQEEDCSSQGLPKRFFSLVDDMGSWMLCCAFGRNALSPALRNDNEVVVYFASGRPAFKAVAPALHLFKDAVIVSLGPKKAQKRMKMDIGSKE